MSFPNETAGVNRKSRVAIRRADNYDSSIIDAALAGIISDLGGISNFVKPGSTVLLKPNLLSPRPPEHAVTTHPAVAVAVARICREAGAAKIWIGDSCAGDHEDQKLWDKTGMTNAFRDLSVELKSFSRNVTSRPAASGYVPVPAWLDQVDSVISLPKLKTHGLTLLTCGVKNIYGMVVGGAKAAYHGTYPSPRAMSEFLAGIYLAFKPELTVVDAVTAMEGEGPANGRPKQVGLLMASADAASIDAVCAGFLKIAPSRIPMLAAVSRLSGGVIEPKAIEITGVESTVLESIRLRSSVGRFLLRVPEPVFKIVSRVMKCQPRIDPKLCTRCGICARICSQNAISLEEGSPPRIDPARCITCMCCAEACPHHAASARSPFGRLRCFFRRLPRSIK